MWIYLDRTISLLRTYAAEIFMHMHTITNANWSIVIEELGTTLIFYH